LINDSSILIAADSACVAYRVERLIAGEFDSVHRSTQPDRTVSDFESLRPAVVILAFDKLEAAQSYRNRLYRSSRLAHVVPHRTIVLCRADELRRVYYCCKSGIFDDYVLLWPETRDRPRLAMAIHHALHLLARNAPDAVSVGEFAAHARHFGSLEPKLAELARRFASEVEVTHAAASAAERSSSATFRQEFPRLCDSVDALCDAARAMANALGPQLQTARAMHELAKRVRPTVLAVDDDVFEQTLLARLLANTKVDLICVSTGAQAFSSIWTRRPDLMLIDADLPDISGIEVIRRLKSVEPLAAIPVIMATAHSQRAIVMESLKAGAVDFIVKPFRRATLLGKLEAFLPAGVI
jgi:CheY-like chemotaxis protein